MQSHKNAALLQPSEGNMLCQRHCVRSSEGRLWWRAIGVLITVGVVLCASMSLNADDGAHEYHEICDIVSKWDESVARGDVEGCRAVLAEGFIYVDASGKIEARHQYLEGVKSVRVKIVYAERTATACRANGQTLVVSSTVGVVASRDGKDISAFYQMTDTFIQDSGKWLAMARQETKVGDRTDPLFERVVPKKGRPLIVLFVQGSYCPHCMTQLTAFASQLKEKNYDVTVVSGSTEQDLKAFPETPFRLVADPEGMLFRRFGAYRDKPLHATIAVDSGGSIVFKTVGNEPYMDTGVVELWLRKAEAATSGGRDQEGGK